MHQLLRALICASLIVFTGVIGVGMLTVAAIKLRVVTPVVLLCQAKSWLNQECAPKPESTEADTAPELALEQRIDDSSHLADAEPSPQVTEMAVAPKEEEPEAAEARENQYNVASAQTEVLGSRAVLRATSAASGSEQPEQPLATEHGKASKHGSGRPTRHATVRRAMTKEVECCGPGDVARHPRGYSRWNAAADRYSSYIIAGCVLLLRYALDSGSRTFVNHRTYTYVVALDERANRLVAKGIRQSK